MRTIYLAGVVIAATALLNACTIGDDTPTATSTPASTGAPVAKLTDKGTTANNNQTTKKTPTFTTAFIPGKGNPSLIEPTDKNKRQEELIKKNSPQVNQSRDPFSPIPGTVSPLVIPRPKVSRTNLPTPIVRINKPVYVPPEPTEAMGVSVSGVVEIAGTQFAIMSIPGESTTRYVKAGQRIANGQVLVKRIDTFGTPSVVLQQYGIEVVRSVGQVVASSTTSDTQSVPAAPPSNSNNTSPINNNPPGVIIPPAGVVPPSGTFVPGLPTINQK